MSGDNGLNSPEPGVPEDDEDLSRSQISLIRAGRMARIAWTLRKAPWSAKVGMLIVLANLTMALFGPFMTQYGQAEIVGSQFERWSAQHVLGTDDLGRDMFTRLIYGGRNSIGIALLVTLLSFGLGGLAGILAAARGGWIDQALARGVDILMAIPQLIFALFLLTILGPSIPVLVGVIALLDGTRVFRLSRALAMNIAAMEFVEVATVRGEGAWWIVRREILPNIVPPLIAEFGIRFCFVFLMISSLSFLGLGIQPPAADWGSMVRDNATLIAFGDVTPLLPAAAIATLAVSVNFVADWFVHLASGLRDDY
jgi:peptide/nickel transport system permease protein